MLPDFLSAFDWSLLILCALLNGISRAGLRGINIIAVPIFAGYFGGKASAGILLPLLISGDIAAMFVYHSKVSWKHVIKLIPAALVGIIVGMLMGHQLPDHIFRLLIAVFVLLCLILMLLKEFRGKTFVLPDHIAAHSTVGFSGGLASMVGNAAGPIMTLYLLSMNLPKEIFIGTGAVFFLVVNLLKLPVHLFVWDTMSVDIFLLDAILIPFVIVGFFGSLKIVRMIPERPFRLFIIFATLAGTIKMLF